MDRFGQKVYSVAYHFTLKREDAEELSQEIFLKIFENLNRYDGSFPLIAWIVSLSRNLCIDRYRRRKREKSFRFVSDDAVLPLLRAADDPSADALRKERTKLLFSALAEIPEDLAEILVLRDLDGLAYDEIGRALELPDGTVKSRLFRARAEVAREDPRAAREPRRGDRHRRHRRGSLRMSCREIERLFLDECERGRAAGPSRLAARRAKCSPATPKPERTLELGTRRSGVELRAARSPPVGPRSHARLRRRGGRDRPLPGGCAKKSSSAGRSRLDFHLSRCEGCREAHGALGRNERLRAAGAEPLARAPAVRVETRAASGALETLSRTSRGHRVRLRARRGGDARGLQSRRPRSRGGLGTEERD